MKAYRVLVVLAAFAAARPLARAQIKPGDQFPSLRSAGLVGPALPAFEGKVVLVDFCASWCAPCRASFPAYERLQSEFGAKGLVIIAVSVDQDLSAFAGFARKEHPTFPLVVDASQRLVARVDVPTMPTSYLLDRSGKVRFIHRGFHTGSTERQLHAEIAGLLAKAAPTP